MFTIWSMRFCGALAAGVMVLLMPRVASSAIVTIGVEPGCNYVATGANNPIAQALTDGHDDLRVTVDVLNVGAAGVFVSDARPQVSIRGGYANCAAAAAGTAPPIAARSRWQGASGQSLFAALSFGPQRGKLLLSGFTLESAPEPFTPAPNGGALVIGGPIDASIENLEMLRFKAEDRGGAMLVATQAKATLRNTEVKYSSAGRGGGIACEEATLLMDADSLVQGNEAKITTPSDPRSGSGGGIYLDRCGMRSESRFQVEEVLASGGISYNYANRLGGAIAAWDSELVLSGGGGCYVTTPGNCRETLFAMVANAAKMGGGGIYADASVVGIGMADIYINQTDNDGGAILGRNGAEVILLSTLEYASTAFCEGNGGCLKLRNNVASWAGGAIALEASNVSILDAFLTDNRASSLGSAISLMDRSHAHIVQSVVSQRYFTSSFHSMFNAGPGSGIRMQSSTAILDNVNAPDAPGMITLSYDAGFHADASVLFARGAPVYSNHPPTEIYNPRCNAVSDASLLDALDAVEISPEDFENPSNPLRPAPSGAMVDICEGTVAPGTTDIEGYHRVVATIPGRESTPQDAGAFEHQGAYVFDDGFESGVWIGR